MHVEWGRHVGGFPKKEKEQERHASGAIMVASRRQTKLHMKHVDSQHAHNTHSARACVCNAFTGAHTAYKGTVT
eukprot:scaffold83290_cov19-Tisochrysis_lutea.AAC.2